MQIVPSNRPKDEPKFYPYEEYLKLPRNPSKWLIDGFLPLGWSSVYAKPKAGKSLLFLSISEALINEEIEWEGFPVTNHGNVLYLQIDTPREIWADNMLSMRLKPDRRFNFFCADAWTTPSHPFNLLGSKSNAHLYDKDNNPITDPEWLEHEIQRINPILIVVDTLREAHNEDEDKSGPMKMVISALQHAAGAGRAIAIIGHSKKDSPFTSNSEDDIMDQGRGTTYIPGKMDMIIRMTRKELHWKGRAIGYKKLPIKQDERYFPIIVRDAEESKSELSRMIDNLCDNNPGISKTNLAAKLAAITNVSERTAYRRIEEWNQQNEARLKALDRLDKEQALPLKLQPLVPYPSPKCSENLWDLPLH